MGLLTEQQKPIHVPLDSIRTHPTLQNRNTTTSMRRERQRAEEMAGHISRLAQNIEAKGLEQPLELMLMTDHEAKKSGQQYWLVGGHHRLEAMTLLKWRTVPATLLSGAGFACARRFSYEQNSSIARELKDDQRLANAWRALNDPDFDDYRKMTHNELAVWARLTDRTIDRMYEVRRRWAAREQGIDYEDARSNAKKQKQRGLRAFNQGLDNYCDQHLKRLYGCDYGALKGELSRGTEVARIEERQLIRRTASAVMEMLNAYGLDSIPALRAVVRQVDDALAGSKTYYEACDRAAARFTDDTNANLQRYVRLLDDASRLTGGLEAIDTPDF